MRVLLLHLSYIIGFSLNGSQGANILGIFPLTLKSHFTGNNAIMKSLIEAGHQVTVITPFPEQASAENYTTIIDTSKGEVIYVSQSSFQEYSDLTIFEMINVTTAEMEISYCYKVMNLPEIQRIFDTNEKLYDVVFIEILFLHKCYYPIAEKLGVPIIITMTVRSYYTADREIGNPFHPAVIPFEFSKTWSSNNLYTRLRNVWDIVMTEWYWTSITTPILKRFREDNVKLFGSNTKFLEMQPNLLFYNNHPSFLSRSMNPNVIEIGGIHAEQAKPLSKDLEKFIDEAEFGVILFSFGSITRTAALPQEILTAFREAFAEVPQRIIWKFEENMQGLSNNVMLMKWLPQRDILEHKNVKVFISHCGQGGSYEAILSATPVIAIPLFLDQVTNAGIMKDLGVAVRLDINNISKPNVLAALNSIVNDTRYYDNMQRLSTIFKDRPMTPKQSVVYWTEYVIKHNGVPHLKTAATQLNWYQYLLLDVLCFVAVLSIISLSIVIYVTKMLYFSIIRIFGKNALKNDKNKKL